MRFSNPQSSVNYLSYEAQLLYRVTRFARRLYSGSQYGGEQVKSEPLKAKSVVETNLKSL